MVAAALTPWQRIGKQGPAVKHRKTLFDTLQWPIRDKNLKREGYMCMYN